MSIFGFEHGNEHGTKNGFEQGIKKLVSNTGQKIVSKTEEKMLRRTVSSTVRAYLHDVFDKELLPVLLSCACHQIVVQLNKKHCITNNDGN